MINATDLLDHAASLIASRGRGAPRQVVLRGAISAAYYSVFHHFAQNAGDLVIGRNQRSSARYVLAYRSIEHRNLHRICVEAAKSSLKPQFPWDSATSSFDLRIREWAGAFQGLYRDRHEADYNPIRKFQQFEAEVAVSPAREAFDRFDAAPIREREWLLTLGLFASKLQIS